MLCCIQAQHKDGEEHDYLLMHPVYSEDWVHSIKPQHKIPEKVITQRSSIATMLVALRCRQEL